VDYRLLSIGALLCWGAWGFLTKLVSKDTSAQTVAFWATVSSLLPITIFAAASGPARWLKPSPLAAVSGLAAGLATICFYLAIKRGPASVVMPLTGMYILIPAVLGIVLLKEPMTLSHILGLVCAALAVFFLSR
jgi:bacterial/archaeal transporter family protein